VLQEAREPTVGALARALPEYQTRVSCGDYPYCGLLILSRWPATLLSHGFWADDGLRGRGWGDPRLRYADITLHLEGGVDVDVAAIHVERRGRLEFDRTQLAHLAQFANQLPHPRRALLSGDFNTAAPSHALADFDGGTTLRRQTFMLASWPSGVRGVGLFAIDHIYAGADLRLLRIRSGPNVGSDHLPIIAEFAVR
jgi:endonuclease/exonuclease/phosphatase (EEP) superfamily protein YafD